LHVSTVPATEKLSGSMIETVVDGFSCAPG
jgi:hypothetical protein